jgi:hypothetical protein
MTVEDGVHNCPSGTGKLPHDVTIMIRTPEPLKDAGDCGATPTQ